MDSIYVVFGNYYQKINIERKGLDYVLRFVDFYGWRICIIVKS